MPDYNPTPSAEQTDAPLLPPILCGPASFLWLWALPVAVLLVLNAQSYALIGGNLDASQNAVAAWLGVANLVNLLGALTLAFLGFRWSRRGQPERLRHPAWSWLIVAAQAGFLWIATTKADGLLPRSVTTWIFPETRYFFNQYAFTMLPLFFGILRLAGLNATGGPRAIMGGLLLALVPPGLLYLAGTVVFRSWFNHPGDVAEVIYGVLFVVMGVLMFTGIIRLTLLVLRLVRRSRTRGELIMVAIIALGLPLGGLALNRDIPFPVDFQAPEVYALAVLNALLLGAGCLLRERRPRLSLGLLCATLPYSLYFFLVFLPFTPLSILAIIAFGAGFLVLTPTFLLTLHLHLLNQARRALPAEMRAGSVWLLCLGSFLLLPAAFSVRALADRAALTGALDYVYSPVIGAGELHYEHSLGNLRRAIDNHRDYKDGLYYPFLSEAYAWLVFDNLVLSDSKLDRIETTFFGAATTTPQRRNNNWGFFGRGGSNRDRNRMPRATPPPHDVEVTDLRWSAAARESSSTVTLRLTLEAPQNTPQSEYIARLPLPEGVFVNGFRLHVNGQPVPGRITEKKTALWVYTMIRDSERRDPGLLFYDGDELELRVFPVVGGTPSIVEIDFLVPGRAEMTLGAPPATPAEAVAALAGLRATTAAKVVVTQDATLLALPPRGLPVVTTRRPYLHLIVDRSATNGYPGNWREALPALRGAFPNATQARVTLAHHDTLDVVPTLTDMDALPSLDSGDLPPRGALSLDAVLARAIRQHRDLDLDAGGGDTGPPPWPVFVVLGKDAPADAPALELAGAWSDCLPGLALARLDAAGNMYPKTTDTVHETPLVRLGNSIRPLTAGRPVEFTGDGAGETPAYWSDRDGRWITLPGIVPLPADSSDWTAAVALHRRQQAHLRSPGDDSDGLRNLVEASRQSGVLIPATSYIVVENDAQWNMLERAEEQKLDQHAALDHKEAPAPGALLIGLPFGAWLLIRRRRRGPMTV